MNNIDRRKFLTLVLPTAAATSLSILSACTPNNNNTVSGIVTKRAISQHPSHSKHDNNENTIKYYVFVDNKKCQVNKKNYNKARIGRWVNIRCGEY